FCYDDFYQIFSKRLPEKINKLKELLLFLIVFAAFILNVSVRDFKYGNFHSIFPLSEIEFLLENNVKGNVFVPFETGSYTAYKLYPNNFILLDGRYEEVYDPSLNDTYVKNISLGKDDWRDKLDSIHHDAVILYKNAPFYNLLLQHEDYFPIVESKKFVLFLRKDVYKNLKKPLKIPTDNPDFYKETLWNTGLDWTKK
ncbi:MAG: hypothetical protein LUE64_05270, partial [Candidatus Gastranaerophilales bacterium]|nr:hypothetical protein [Candidatus Gastranaerophilales bacterium]